MIKDLEENEDFHEIIKTGEFLVDFHAHWCGPCKMLSPILEELSKEVNILKINVDTHNELALKHGVMSIPTIIYFKDGVLVEKVVGFKTKEELLKLIGR